MLCDDVRRVVYFFLDGSLGDQKQHDFTTHLSICPECEARTTLSRRLRAFVRRRLMPSPAPEQLRIRVIHAIRASQ